MRVQIQESQTNVDPCRSGSETPISRLRSAFRVQSRIRIQMLELHSNFEPPRRVRNIGQRRQHKSKTSVWLIHSFEFRAQISKLLRSPKNDSKEPIPPACVACASILKLLRSPGIHSKKSIPPANVAWRAGTTTLFLLGSPPPCIQCCGSGMFIPDPGSDFFPSRNPEPGSELSPSRIPDPHQRI